MKLSSTQTPPMTLEQFTITPAEGHMTIGARFRSARAESAEGVEFRVLLTAGDKTLVALQAEAISRAISLLQATLDLHQ
jgi:hypothetical protein